jgi:hypothetical protein
MRPQTPSMITRATQGPPAPAAFATYVRHRDRGSANEAAPLPQRWVRAYADCMTPPPLSRKAALVAALAVGLSACRSRTADLGMSDSAFVTVMSELKVIADAPDLTPTVRQQRRDAVFRNRGVSAAQIEALGTELTAHPQHARQLWAAIDVKTEKLRQAGPK